MLGILVLDTAFPRIPGDVGAPETFPFPVRHAVVRGASVDGVVHTGDRELLPRFVAAALELQAQGCVAIVTTCGFLAAWQDDLSAALDVPILTSALFQWSLVQRTLPRGRRVGILTYSAEALTPALLHAAQIPPDTPVAGMPPTGYFAHTIRNGAPALDAARMRDEVVGAAQHLVARHPDIGALVLECANMPPYAQSVAHAVGRPVFDAVDLMTWFHVAISRGAPRVSSLPGDDAPPSRSWSSVPP